MPALERVRELGGARERLDEQGVVGRGGVGRERRVRTLARVRLRQHGARDLERGDGVARSTHDADAGAEVVRHRYFAVLRRVHEAVFDVRVSHDRHRLRRDAFQRVVARVHELERRLEAQGAAEHERRRLARGACAGPVTRVDGAWGRGQRTEAADRADVGPGQLTGAQLRLERRQRQHDPRVAPGALDFETTPTLAVEVTVTDGGSPVLAATATVTVILVDMNEPPVLGNATFDVPENSADGVLVGCRVPPRRRRVRSRVLVDRMGVPSEMY